MASDETIVVTPDVDEVVVMPSTPGPPGPAGPAGGVDLTEDPENPGLYLITEA